MADKKISDLVEAMDISGTDFITAVTEQGNVKISKDNFLSNYYHYVKTIDTTITADTYQSLAQLHLTNQIAGTYQVTFSTTFTYDSTNRSAYFRWSIDNGVTWEEFNNEPKDKTDKKALAYVFPTDFLGGDIDIILQARCESTSDVLNVLFANIIVERKA